MMLGNIRLIVKKYSFLLLYGVVSTFQSIFYLLLARRMGKEDYGIIATFSAGLNILLVFVLMGMNNAAVRHFTRENTDAIDLSRTLSDSVFRSSLLVVLGVVSYTLYMPSMRKYAIWLFLITLMFAVNSLVSAIFFRAKERFNYSVLVEKGAYIIALLGVFILLCINIEVKPELVLATLFFSLVFIFTFTIKTINKNNHGKGSLPVRFYSDGLMLWGSNLVLAILANVDRILLSKLISFEVSGEYFYILNFFMPWNILLQGMSYYLIPLFKIRKNKNEWIKIVKRYWVVLFGATGLYSIGVFVISTKLWPMSSVAIPVQSLIVGLGVITIVKAIYQIVSSAISAIGSSRMLGGFLIFNVTMLCLVILLECFLMPSMGVMAIIIGSLMFFFFRTLQAAKLLSRE